MESFTVVPVSDGLGCVLSESAVLHGLPVPTVPVLPVHVLLHEAAENQIAVNSAPPMPASNEAAAVDSGPSTATGAGCARFACGGRERTSA